MRRTLTTNFVMATISLAAVGCTKPNPLFGQGRVGGECYPNGTCNGGLSCISGFCEDPNNPKLDSGIGTTDSRASVTSAAVDILFVIDNSGSMQQEQAMLAKSFAFFVDSLRRFELGSAGNNSPCTRENERGCRLPSLRIGVISSDMGAGGFAIPSCEEPDNGQLLFKPQVAGCEPPSAPWIAFDGKTSNVKRGSSDHTQRVVEAFQCISQIGIQGCGLEQPLEAAKRALDPELQTNPGFLRPDAALAIVFLTDEDDCSARQALFNPDPSTVLGPLTSFRCFDQGVSCNVNGRTAGPRSGCVPATNQYFSSVQGYVSFFRSLKPGGKVIMAAIAGPTSPVSVVNDAENGVALGPSCRGGAGVDAVPAIRLKAVVDAFPSHFASICQKDFGASLSAIGQILR
jgi:hypothetical protein